jgi:hypothetical protein
MPKKRHQEIRNVDRQARSAQHEPDCVNQGGNQVIPLARHEFDNNYRGFRHTLGEMTTVLARGTPCTFWKSMPHQIRVLIHNLHYVAHKVK